MREQLWKWTLVLALAGCAHAQDAPARQTDPPPADPGPPRASSGRFDNLNFARATVSKDEQGGITAKFGIGVDVVGTLRADAQGQLTYEQHPVMFRGGPPPAPLSPEDRASLAAALERQVGAAGQAADPLWQQLLTDAKK